MRDTNITDGCLGEEAEIHLGGETWSTNFVRGHSGHSCVEAKSGRDADIVIFDE